MSRDADKTSADPGDVIRKRVKVGRGQEEILGEQICGRAGRLLATHGPSY